MQGNLCPKVVTKGNVYHAKWSKQVLSLNIFVCFKKHAVNNWNWALKMLQMIGMKVPLTPRMMSMCFVTQRVCNLWKCDRSDYEYVSRVVLCQVIVRGDCRQFLADIACIWGIPYLLASSVCCLLYLWSITTLTCYFATGALSSPRYNWHCSTRKALYQRLSQSCKLEQPASSFQLFFMSFTSNLIGSQ